MRAKGGHSGAIKNKNMHEKNAFMEAAINNIKRLVTLEEKFKI